MLLPFTIKSAATICLMTQMRVHGLSVCMSESKTINILEWCVQINNHTELKCNNTGPSFVVYYTKKKFIELNCLNMTLDNCCVAN